MFQPGRVGFAYVFGGEEACRGNGLSVDDVNHTGDEAVKFNPFVSEDEKCVAVGGLPEKGSWSVNRVFFGLGLDVAFGGWDEVGLSGQIDGGQSKGDAEEALVPFLELGGCGVLVLQDGVFQIWCVVRRRLR
jgi:hypothetical protein